MTKRKGSLAPIKIVVSPIPASSRRVTGNVILPCPSKEVLKSGIHPKVVSELLGHANIGIMLDIYSHILPDLQKAAAEKFDRIFEVDYNEN
jgi:integrase